MPARSARLLPVLQLQQQVVVCTRCPRLVEHRQQVAQEKRRAYLDWDYWGKAVPAWGDPAARVMVLGLAPAAHGANRTGRMFTGDRSGDYLYQALWETGFASQPESTHRDDGLVLRDVWVTASARCAPPDNKPSPEELRNCRPYLEQEFALLPHLRVVVALGKIAADTYLAYLKERGQIRSAAPYRFGHGALYEIPAPPGTAAAPALLCSYHPSQQNTFTGRLTHAMLREIFETAAALASSPKGGRLSGPMENQHR